jgi:hypothetical protein
MKQKISFTKRVEMIPFISLAHGFTNKKKVKKKHLIFLNLFLYSVLDEMMVDDSNRLDHISFTFIFLIKYQ